MKDSAENLAAAIERDAQLKAGSVDFGDGGHHPALLAFARDLLSPQLNEFGQGFLRRLAVNAMVRRLRVLACLREHPEIDEVVLPPIILISGLARTGTTLAHNLLALRTGARALLRWELMEPVPPPEVASYATDARIAKLQSSIEPLRGSVLEQMHWVNADEPEECAWGYLDGRSMLGQGCMAAMPQWAEHLRVADPRPTFREYRRLIRLLLWRNPLPEGGVLVLKCPQIAAQLQAFAEVFPEASFVLTHRDPYRALVSTATVLHAINQPFLSSPPRLRRDECQWLEDGNAAALERMRRFAEGGLACVAHLPYPDLVADGAGAFARVLRELALEVDEAFSENVAGFLERQRRGHRAAPPSSYDDFGYTHDAVLAEPRVAAYCARFGVQRERVRRTGV